MPAERVVAQLNQQIAHEFAAEQQYLACAVHFDGETLPRLAKVFYAQALEERNHAMMMVRYLLDTDAEVVVPGVAAPRTAFADIVEPVALALEQERRVSEQIAALAATARQEHDFPTEEFLQWFIKEQVEEVAKMGDLLRICRRATGNPLTAEEFIAREGFGEEGEGSSGPPVAGGAV